MNQLRVLQASRKHRPILHRLMQLYQYDFTEYEGNDPNADGIFEYKWLNLYWSEPGRIPFIVYLGRTLAGFVLVNQSAILSKDPRCRTIAEFFILKKYRRRQIGSRVAFRIFDRFRGSWEIQQTKANVIAHRFWRGVIRTYTKGKFQERIVNDRRWRGWIQNFQNGDAGHVRMMKP